MAKASITQLHSNSLGDFSLYTMRGVEKKIIRFKGGPSAAMIKKSPKFEAVRNQQSQIGGMGKLSHYLSLCCKGVKHLGDHNSAANFSKIASLIQKMDTLGEAGKAAVMFSKFGSILNGFNFNTTNPFNSVVTPLPKFSISREEYKGTVTFQDLYPGINLQNTGAHPLCRFIVSIGLVPDLVYSKSGYGTAFRGFTSTQSVLRGPWLVASSKIDAFTLEAFLSERAKFDDSVSILLSVGIEFGTYISNAVIQPIKRAGCATILGVG